MARTVWSKILFYVLTVIVSVSAVWLYSQTFTTDDPIYAIAGWAVAICGLFLLISVAVHMNIIQLYIGVALFVFILINLLFLWLIGTYWGQCFPRGVCEYYKFTLDVTQALAPLIGALAIALQLWEMIIGREGNEKRPT